MEILIYVLAVICAGMVLVMIAALVDGAGS